MSKILSVIYLYLLFLSLVHTQNCIIDPSPPSCENYVLPNSNVTNSINMMCSIMTYMPGCSVSSECAKGDGSGIYCNPFSHLKEICTEMSMMKGCQEYNSLCLPDKSSVKECNTPVLPLPTQSDLYHNITSICNDMFMPECKLCTNIGNCDVFVVYSSLCTSMPSMKQCGPWRSYCGFIPDWVVCGGTPALDCIHFPWVSGCENFILPEKNVTSDIQMLCSSMPFMPGCSINNECAIGHGSGIYCNPFSLLKEICLDMGGMVGCEDYDSMCSPNNTKVLECNTPILPLPNQAALWDQISAMCKEMYMPDCDQCQHDGQCDVLSVYSSLCFTMPGMPQCGIWHQICGKISNWVMCTGEPGHVQPIMRMYFHTDITDYILFYQWVPRDILTYTLSVVAVVAIAFFHEAIRTLKSILEYKLRKSESQKFRETTPLHSLDARYPPFLFWKEFFRAVLRTLDNTLHFLIMLIAMTFNVGLFVGVMGGYFLGFLFFGRFLRPMEPLILTTLGEEEVCH